MHIMHVNHCKRVVSELTTYLLAFSPSSSSADLAKSNCSSCAVKEDKSAYWTPALYFMNTDDNMVEVVPEKPPHKT